MKLLQEVLRAKIVSGCKDTGKSSSPVKRWLDTEMLNQSQCIRFGIYFEEAMNDYVALSPLYTNITTSEKKMYITSKGKIVYKGKDNIDVDILLHRGNKYYYRECKCNLLLDSEKSKTTAKKLLEVKRRLELAYPGYEIDAAILCMDWSGTKEKYCGVPLEYVGDFINRLEVEEAITEEQYLAIGRELGKEIVNDETNY